MQNSPSEFVSSLLCPFGALCLCASFRNLRPILQFLNSFRDDFGVFFQTFANHDLVADVSARLDFLLHDAVALHDVHKVLAHLLHEGFFGN